MVKGTTAPTEKALAAIAAAVHTQNFDTARSLSDAYVAANPAAFTGLAGLELSELVARIDSARTTSDVNAQWLIEAYLLHRYEPQNIGGTYQPAIRVPR